MAKITEIKPGTKIKVPNGKVFEVVENRFIKGINETGNKASGRLVVKDEQGQVREWDEAMIKDLAEIAKVFEQKLNEGKKRKK